MSKVAIFVSHRTDLDSNVIPNPLYHNMFCGAWEVSENAKKLRDDTGDNISKKKPYYSEYTIQYWMWKNYKADYYGLCHYRRYLSFADHLFPESNTRFAIADKMSWRNYKKYQLNNPFFMKREIEKYDVTTSITYDTQAVPLVPPATNVYDLMTNHPHLLISPKDLDLLISIVKEKYPQYYEAVMLEVNSNVHRGFNCFVMRKDLFFQMCEFEFGVLFEIESEIDLSIYQGNPQRVLGYLGEILYGSFIRWIQMQGKYSVCERQIVLFNDTQRKSIKNIIYENTKSFLKKIVPSYRCILRLEEKFDQQRAELAVIRREVNRLSKKIESLNQRDKLTFWMDAPIYPADMNDKKLDFWRSFPVAEGDLRIVQKANTVLLKEFKEMCDSLDVQFWLHGGSLVGGVRHQGCVPWDDDIDIAMMRSDYQKVVDYLSESQTFEIKEYYYIGLGCRSYRFRRNDLQLNCFVDIFLYDNYDLTCGNSLNDWRKVVRLKQGLQQQCRDLCYVHSVFPEDPTLDDNQEFKNVLDTLFELYIKRIQSKETSEWICWGLDNNYEDHTRFAWHNGRIFNKKDIFPLQKCIYEGIECCVPANFEIYVFAEYGIGYLEMPDNMGESIHWKQYFDNPEQIEMAKEL
ncbi:DUF4422 domain-containing protein, partial [Hydrogenoanaerobacterium sp.]|uniref:DUF4422 domain-containing protein n=1 Tax=Hydrogenoanaerobacterium sp. TaxID=2953763 RepID=UPI0028A2B5FB